jgi:hypothetical protein
MVQLILRSGVRGTHPRFRIPIRQDSVSSFVRIQASRIMTGDLFRRLFEELCQMGIARGLN